MSLNPVFIQYKWVSPDYIPITGVGSLGQVDTICFGSANRSYFEGEGDVSDIVLLRLKIENVAGAGILSPCKFWIDNPYADMYLENGTVNPKTDIFTSKFYCEIKLASNENAAPADQSGDWSVLDGTYISNFDIFGGTDKLKDTTQACYSPIIMLRMTAPLTEMESGAHYFLRNMRFMTEFYTLPPE